MKKILLNVLRTQIRFKTTKNYNKNVYKNSMQLTRMVEPSSEHKNRIRKNKPKNSKFHVSQEMKFFNDKVYQNLSVMKSGAILSDLINSYQVEFISAQVTPKFNDLLIYWKTSKSGHVDNEIQKYLDSKAPDVRYELNNLQYFGQIPKITFVKAVEDTENIIKTFEKIQVENHSEEMYQVHEPPPSMTKTNVLNFDRQKVMQNVSWFSSRRDTEIVDL